MGTFNSSPPTNSLYLKPPADSANPSRGACDCPTERKSASSPDRVFGLEYAGPDGKPVRAYYFLEADRGTMPIQRHNLSQSSIYRKLLAYEATWTQNLHRTRLGLRRFRVLTVTSNPGRVKTLVEACRQLQRGQGLFLFTDADDSRSHSNPLARPWASARRGIPESLVDPLHQPSNFPATKGKI